ncbi:ead/Ea22-like family protein [Salmonella enterica subsp. enterica serovar Abeokuta]|uniref:Ead/Ea22-like family protein n=1 Tax=Salmonella enterica subsp. enterica serovar Abeokuta TaxID=2926665 RepID=A0A8T9IPK4_SALET|nr:ead/Ea22-like family protein [Salmonella enterica]UNO35766.1 ead/Ea22-like family protein [Salmonella enterica subsp. enterica serovar Abeokuta]
MTAIKIYTATPADLSPPVQSESFCVDLVLASDYRELEAKCAALVAECESKKSALAAILEHCPVNDPDIDKAVAAMIAYENLYCEKAPAADAFRAEMQAQARKEGAHFVANRMLAAWDAGFIDDTAKNAADIARMILTSTEFMADAPEGDFDRSFADGVLEDIAAQLRKGVQS